MKTAEQIRIGISRSIGTEKYTRHFMGLLMTDGVVQLREDADCYWLIDAIASYKRTEEFQIWELKVDLEKKTAVLTMKEDSDKPAKVKQEFEYTNFPLDNVKFYLQLGSIDGVNPAYILMLTNEY